MSSWNLSYLSNFFCRGSGRLWPPPSSQSTWPLWRLLQAMSPWNQGLTFCLQAKLGRALYVQAWSPGADQQALPPGLAPAGDHSGTVIPFVLFFIRGHMNSVLSGVWPRTCLPWVTLPGASSPRQRSWVDRNSSTTIRCQLTEVESLCVIINSQRWK